MPKHLYWADPATVDTSCCTLAATPDSDFRHLVKHFLREVTPGTLVAPGKCTSGNIPLLVAPTSTLSADKYKKQIKKVKKKSSTFSRPLCLIIGQKKLNFIDGRGGGGFQEK